MERSLRIERAARVRAEQAARHAKAAIATAETLREATVKAAAVQLEAGMARQERLLKKQAELKRELQVVSQICKDSEALEGESSYARQIGRLKAWLHVTSAFRPPALLALTGPSRRAARGPTGEAAVRPRGPAKVADDATQPTNTTQAQLRGKAEAEEAVVAKARGFAEQARRTALHAVAPASHPRDGWHCTVYLATRAVGVAQSQTSTETRALARTRARVRRRWWRCRRA